MRRRITYNFASMKRKKRRSGGGFNAITSCISTTMVLILFGTVVFFVTMADNLSRSLRENFSVQVLLSDSTTNAEAYRLQGILRTQPYTRLVSYTSKEKATREQAELLDTDPEEFLGYSPIPASFEVHLKAEYANNDSLTKYTPELKKEARITDVIYPQDLMDTVNENIRRVSIVLLAVALLLGFVSFALINNTMRMSVYARRFSIHTMKQVGAKWSFIRRPFMARAFWIGFFSVLMADGVLLGGIYSVLQWEPNASGVITPLVLSITLGSVAVFGLFLTMACAFFSVNRHLRMSGNKVYMH